MKNAKQILIVIAAIVFLFWLYGYLWAGFWGDGVLKEYFKNQQPKQLK